MFLIDTIKHTVEKKLKTCFIYLRDCLGEVSFVSFCVMFSGYSKNFIHNKWEYIFPSIYLSISLFAKDDYDEEKEHPDIEHTAPQHRQYLGNTLYFVSNEVCYCFDFSFIPPLNNHCIGPVKGLTWTLNRFKRTTVDIQQWCKPMQWPCKRVNMNFEQV